MNPQQNRVYFCAHHSLHNTESTSTALSFRNWRKEKKLHV